MKANIRKQLTLSDVHDWILEPRPIQLQIRRHRMLTEQQRRPTRRAPRLQYLRSVHAMGMANHTTGGIR